LLWYLKCLLLVIHLGDDISRVQTLKITLIKRQTERKGSC
jgi:hypothetical protein